MRDRLIELLRQMSCVYADCEGFCRCTGCKKMEMFDDEIESLADCLLANGVIVPPCKVGDTVYEFFDVRGFYSITELIVENIVVGVNPPKCVLYTKSKQSNSKDRFFNDSFGKTLFFTKEEAEQALKGGEK